MRPNPPAICALFMLFLGACAHQTPMPEVNRLIERSHGADLPDPETGRCSASSVTPAVVETQTEQVPLADAEYAPDGSVVRPALFETRTRKVVIQDKVTREFDVVCAADMTPEFIYNLQGALAQRGFYKGRVTGRMNLGTRRAIRLYQIDQGLNSTVLSRQTAEALGLFL